MSEIFNVVSLLVCTITLIAAYVYVGRKSFGTAFALFTAAAALATIRYHQDVKELLSITNVVGAAVVFGIIYLICGLMIACAFWISYVTKAKATFDRHFNNQLKSSIVTHCYIAMDESKREEYVKSYARYCTLNNRDYLRDIFDDPDRDLSIYLDMVSTYYSNERLDDETLASLKKQYDDAFGKVIPPRFSVCKPFIFGAAAVWPVTAAWLLMNNVLKKAGKWVISSFSGVFNKISNQIFGSF